MFTFSVFLRFNFDLLFLLFLEMFNVLIFGYPEGSSRKFRGVLGSSRGLRGSSDFFQGVPGSSGELRGSSDFFRGVPGSSGELRGGSDFFRGVPGSSGELRFDPPEDPMGARQILGSGGFCFCFDFSRFPSILLDVNVFSYVLLFASFL